MSKDDLHDIAAELVAEGHVDEASSLREVREDLEVVERPPGLFSRLSTSVRETAQRQWSHIVGELQESQEAWGLIQRRVTQGEDLSTVERDVVKAQLLDIFKVFPATIVATANSVFPVPGTGLLTPWLLKKMGLMPTQWREAHALHQLQEQEEHLRSIGDVDHADKVQAVIERLSREAAARQEVEQKCALLTVWDENQNGEWDPEEIGRYRDAVLEMRSTMEYSSQKKLWFLMLHSHVFGPVRLEEADDWTPDEKLLICFNADSGWVTYQDLVRTDGRLSVEQLALEGPPKLS